MSYVKILSHPVGDTNFFNDLIKNPGSYFQLYGTIYGKYAYKRPRITTDSLRVIFAISGEMREGTS